MAEHKPLCRLKQIDGLQEIAHYETSEYEVMVSAQSAAMRNLTVQICSIDYSYTMGYCRDADESLETAMAEIAKLSKQVVVHAALKDRELKKKYNEYSIRN